MAPTLSKKQWVLSHIVLLLLLLLCAQPLFEVTGRSLVVSVLDVGQGDAILIQTPDFKNILIDAGPDAAVVDQLGERMAFFDKTIDLFILTHPHRDHAGGILDVMKQYDIRQVMMTGATSHDPFYTAFLSELERRSIDVIYPQNDRDISLGQHVYLDLLYPLSGQSFIGQSVDNQNNASVVMRLRRQTDEGWENLAILTGDAEQEEEREILLAGQDVQAGVQKLGHHGSRTSTSDGFLDAVNPEKVVVSAGVDNQFKHPHPETLEKVEGLEVHQTMGSGAVVMEF